MKRCFEFELLAEEEEWEGWQYIKWCIPTILMKEMILVWSLVRLRQYIKWCIQHISKNRKSKMRACSVRRDKTFLKVISSLFLLTTLFLWLFGNILTSFYIFFLIFFLLFAIFMAFCCCFLVLVYLFISVIFFFCLFCILHSLSEFELILDVGLE